MYHQRHIYPIIRKHLDEKEYTLIVGARQVGKTSLIRELYRTLKQEGRRVFYLSFENTDVLREVNTHPENVFRFIDRPINPLDASQESGQRIILFIDEVQYASDPSGFLKYLFDTYLDHLKIVATGSSAFYMDEKFDDSLAGRKMVFRLNRLNFIEFLGFKGRDDLAQEVIRKRERPDYLSLKAHEIEDQFSEYLVYGGYPAVVLEEDTEFKRLRLLELRDSWLKRDVQEAGVRNEADFYNLTVVLADQSGNLLNKNELTNTLRMNYQTVNNYLNLLEKCFHIDLVRPFFRSIRKEISKMQKVFFWDNGLRNAMLNRFSTIHDRADRGALLENYLFIRLMEKHWPTETRFWRTADGHEIDFVVTEDLRTGAAYEVKYGKAKISQKSSNKFQSQYPQMSLSAVDFAQAVYL